MKNINYYKTKESFKYFIFITIMPIIGIIVIFSYAFLHLQKDLKFINDEISGLKTIKEIQNTVVNIQRLRGLGCIEEPTEESLKELELVKDNISKDLIKLRQNIAAKDKDLHLKKGLLDFIDSIESSSLEFASFSHLTKVIEEFMNYTNRISYGCNLILDPQLDSFVLIDNVVYLLPKLIEYNGQIRAIATSTVDMKLTQQQKKNFTILVDKIKENLKKLEFNFTLLHRIQDNSDIMESYKKMCMAQNVILEFTEENLIKSDNIPIEPNGIFTLITKCINIIIDLHGINSVFLEKSLEERLEYTKKLSIYVILAGLVSILFIAYINGLFYYKNKKFIKEIQKLTITDSMTSLYNRRHFDKVFEDNLKIQSRTKQPLAFIILDIDFFKQFNDTYGHQAGDYALKVVADNLKVSLKRAGDMAFRLGGEEFGILCIGMNRDEALSFATSIKERIENEKLKHEKNSVSEYLTISMGVIVVEPDMFYNTNEIYKCADEALYKAKENGRNRVVVYNEETQV